MIQDATETQLQETRDNWSLRASEWNQQADHMARLAKGLNLAYPVYTHTH